jgi:hypothetical protein
VQWDPTITYTAFASASLDANGLRQNVYKASEDFTLAGRPGAVVTLPQEGPRTSAQRSRRARRPTT